MQALQPTNEDLGTALRRLRKQRKLTIEELARQATVHGTYVSLIERGQANPTWDVISSITTALNTKPSKLVSWAEEACAARTAAEGNGDTPA